MNKIKIYNLYLQKQSQDDVSKNCCYKFRSLEL